MRFKILTLFIGVAMSTVAKADRFPRRGPPNVPGPCSLVQAAGQLKEALQSEVSEQLASALFLRGLNINDLQVNVESLGSDLPGLVFQVQARITDGDEILEARTFTLDGRLAPLAFVGRVSLPRRDPDGRPIGHAKCVAIASDGLVVRMINLKTGEEIVKFDVDDFTAYEL